MLILTQEVHDEMTGLWATSGKTLLRALGYDEAKADIAYGEPMEKQHESTLSVLRFVAEQRLAARKPRRRVRKAATAKP